MEYILLIAGLALAIYGLLGIKEDSRNYNLVEEPLGGIDSFSRMLLDSDILRRLKIIEEKIDGLKPDREYLPIDKEYIAEETVKTQFNIKPEEVNDLNHQILRMKNDGMNVEEIADSLGIMKGEVLLRLGMRK